MSRTHPTYPLREIQALVRADRFIVTATARGTADELGFGEREIVACILGLTPRDFYKSMESRTVAGLWQDVYRP